MSPEYIKTWLNPLTVVGVRQHDPYNMKHIKKHIPLTHKNMVKLVARHLQAP